MARRVNTPFLIILAVLVVGLGLGAFLFKKFLIRESPEKYVALGSAAMADKKYEDAVKSYARAVSLDPKNPSLWVAYGDALNQLSPQDVEYMSRAQKAWASALAVDATNKPALDRMMQFWSDYANLDPSPYAFKQLGETAGRLHEADPKNAAAEIAIHTSKIRPWLAGVEQDEKEMSAEIDKLIELMQKHPDNADLPMFASQAKLRMAERRRQQDRPEEAKKSTDEANDIMARGLKTVQSASMYFSAAQVAQAQEMNALRGTDAEGIKNWREKKREYYAKAREMVTPEDQLYVHIHTAAARANADRAEAEKILRDLIKVRPDDQQVRLALAEQLASARLPDTEQPDEAKRAEAIEILDRPFAPTGLIGAKAYMIRELQIRTLVAATNLRLEAFARTKDENERKELLDKISKGLDVIAARDGDGPRVLRLRGKLQILQGETVKAIQTLERARGLAERSGGTEGEVIARLEVIDMLARAYIKTGQSGRARELLTQLVNSVPGYDPARMLLAQVLVKDGDIENAQPHVSYLAQKTPNDPDVIKLQIQVLGPKDTQKKNDASVRDQIKATFGKLPEENKQEILDKVGAALYIDQPEEGIRLLNKAQTKFAGDADVAKTAVRLYRNTGDVAAAKAFVEASLAVNPKDEKLLLLQKQVADLTPEGLARVSIEEIDKNPDVEPHVRELVKYNAYRRLGDSDKALEHLMAAKKLKPDDGDVNALLFNHYLTQKQWDKAEVLMETLARSNQDQTGGLLFRYRLAMARQDYQRALDYANALVQRMGEFGQSWLARGQVLQAKGELEEALKNYLAALERQSDSVDAYKGAIDCYYLLNRPAEASRKIKDARRALPTNVSFQEVEIQHELTYGDPEKAVPAREEAVKKDASKPANVMALGQAYLAAARSKVGRNDPDQIKKAEEYFRKAKATFRDGITKWPDEIAFYAYYAETGARSGEPGESEALLKQLAARDAWKDRTEPKTLLAEFYGVSNRAGEAEASLRAVLEKDPSSVDTRIKLANLLVNQQKVDEALKVLEAGTANPALARRRVEILVSSGRHADAEKALDEILEKTPSSLEMLQLAAGVNISRQKFDLADQRLKRAIEIDGDNPTTHYYLGLLYMNQPKPDIDKAMGHLERGKDSPVVGTDSRFAMADCLRRKSDPDGAIRQLEAALKAQPMNKRVRLVLIDSYVQLQPPRWVDAERVMREAKELPGYKPDSDILQREAAMYADRGDFKTSVDRVNEALTASPNDLRLTQLGLGLLNRARRYPEVVQKADALVAKDPSLWWAYQARAVARRYQDRKEDATKDFESALAAANTLHDDNAMTEIVKTMGDVMGPDEAIRRIAPRAEKDDKWKVMIARLYEAKGDRESATKNLEEVLARADQLQPADREGAYRFGGTLYLMANKPEESHKCYVKLLDMAPDDMTALNNMACLLAEVMVPPRPQEGLKYSQHAYDLMMRGNRKDALVLDTHGWLLTLSGRVDEGIEILRAANDLRQMPDIHYHLGEAYLRKQFAEQAQRELELALELFKRFRQEKQPVDSSLEPKIEGALARAGVMMRQQKGGAAPTAGAAPAPAVAP